MKDIKWWGELPYCDICGNPDAFYDVPTTVGPWANLCDPCLHRHTSANGRAIGTKRIPYVDKKHD